MKKVISLLLLLLNTLPELKAGDNEAHKQHIVQQLYNQGLTSKKLNDKIAAADIAFRNNKTKISPRVRCSAIFIPYYLKEYLSPYSDLLSSYFAIPDTTHTELLSKLYEIEKDNNFSSASAAAEPKTEISSLEEALKKTKEKQNLAPQILDSSVTSKVLSTAIEKAQPIVKDMKSVIPDLNENKAYQSQLIHQTPLEKKLSVRNYLDPSLDDSSELANQLSFLSLKNNKEKIPVTLEDVKKITDKKSFLYRMSSGFLEKISTLSTLDVVNLLLETNQLTQEKADYILKWLKDNPKDQHLNKLKSIFEEE